MTGLSSANFMSGLMQGYGFADRMSSNQQARGLRDAQESREKERHKQRSDINAQTIESNDLAIKQKKQNILTNDALREARIIAEKGGSPLSVLKQDKYAPLGMGIIGDSESRKQTIKDGRVIQSSFENTRFEPAVVDTMERHLAPKFKALQEKDGLKRRLTGILREGENKFSLEYVVTKPDGTQYVAEHTVNNSSDPNDPMRVFTLQDFAKIGGTISQRAAVASELEKYAGDPQRELEALEFMLTGKKPAKPKYTVQKGWGRNGGDQLVRIGPDGKFAGYVGGEKAKSMSDADYKAKNAESKIFHEYTKRYIADKNELREQIEKSRREGTTISSDQEKVLYQNLDNEYIQSTGFNPSHTYSFSRQFGRMPYSREELNVFFQGRQDRIAQNKKNKEISEGVDDLVADNPNEFGSEELTSEVPKPEDKTQIAGNPDFKTNENQKGFVDKQLSGHRFAAQQEVSRKFINAENPAKKLNFLGSVSRLVDKSNEESVKAYKDLLSQYLQIEQTPTVRKRMLAELAKYSGHKEEMAAVFTN